MATEEDFSFPVIADTFSTPIDSPPLWCLSPAASPGRFCYHEEAASEGSTETERSDQDEDFKDCFPIELSKNLQRRSLSCLEEVAAKLVGGAMYDHHHEDEKEDKMDMLWEDFNTEELFTGSDNERLESAVLSMGCAEAFRSTKTSSHGPPIISPRRPSLVVFMKVLKKLFLLHNSHRSVRHHCPPIPVKNHT